MEFNSFDKEYTLDTLVSLVITQYSFNSFFNEAPDTSVQESFLIKELKRFGCTLDEIDNAIAKKDFTNQLTHYGSGDRERGFVMEYIEEIWNRE